jgi:hypothetical protein
LQMMQYGRTVCWIRRQEDDEGDIMMNRKEAIKEYKKTIQPMGIVLVRNVANGRIYLTASANTAGTINSIRFQLKMGTFLPSPDLAQDWKEMGEQSFVIEVIDELKPVEDPAYDYREDLKELEAMWMEKLKPYGARGYHCQTGK